MARFLAWHRRLGWVAAAAILLWAGSGLLHPIMVWTAVRPVAFAPPAGAAFTLPADAADPSALLARHDIDHVAALRVLDHEGRLVLQARLPHRPQRRYFDVVTGAEIEDLDRTRAIALARHYTGRTEPVAAAEPVGAFDPSYPSINRFLPVWRVSFAGPDGIAAYVDTGSDRLATITDPVRLGLLAWFQAIHTQSWLSGAEPARIALIACAVVSVILTAGAGLALVVLRRGSRRSLGIRGWHRIIGHLAWIPAFTFAGSGLLHLALMPADGHGGGHDHGAAAHSLTHVVSDIRMPPLAAGARLLDLRLAQGSGSDPVWRVRLAEADAGRDVRYLLPDGTAVVEGEHVRAALAARLGTSPTALSEPALVQRFSADYGFVNKRLPVWRLERPQTREVLFFDAQDDVIAARADPLSRTEGWVFANFHKWAFLDDIGSRNRDIAMSGAALLLIAAAVVGAALGFNLPRRRKTRTR